MAINTESPEEALSNVFHPNWHKDLDQESYLPLAWVEIDLNDSLHFEKSALTLWPAKQDFAMPHMTQVNAKGLSKQWDLTHDSYLRLTDHAGVGHLSLYSNAGLVHSWHFTLAINTLVSQFKDHFQIRHELPKQLVSDAPILDKSTTCPFCYSPIPSNQTECMVCDPETEVPPSTLTLFKLWRFAKPYKKDLLLGFVLTLLSTAATLVPPYISMPLMDQVLIPFQTSHHMDFELAGKYLGGLLIAALVAWGLGWWKTYILALVSERIGMELRTKTFQHLINLSLEYFGAKRTGDLMARIGNETDRICIFLSLHLLDFLTDMLMLIMTASILISIDPLLALVTLLPLPFIAWMIHYVRDKLRYGFEKVDRNWSEVNNVLSDTIPGIRVVKAFAQEDRENTRFIQANQRNLEVNDRVNRTWSSFAPTVTLLTEIGLLVVWAFGIYQVANDKITVGVLTAFLAYISRFYSRMDSMSRIVSHTQKAAAGAKRVFDILDHESSVPETKNPVPLPKKVQGQIDLSNVSFRYGNRTVTKNVNLQIKPGEMIGLVGHSGSGKSTLVNLICRFYDVSDGSVKIDGIDVRNIATNDFRKLFGMVLQEPFLFFGTIAENIAYGKPEATKAEIVQAAKAANAHDFILRLPLGYDSLVGERGQSLSGGERQRISIARALLIDPRILVLDEATSSVDTTTEKEIQKALDNLVKGRTTLAIAHRLSTLRKADRLIVLDKGEIVEVGSHDELMITQGTYYQLYQAQARHAAEIAESI
jgi:ATP-binding cassette subfamily B protein